MIAFAKWMWKMKVKWDQRLEMDKCVKCYLEMCCIFETWYLILKARKIYYVKASKIDSY